MKQLTGRITPAEQRTETVDTAHGKVGARNYANCTY